MIKNEIQLKNNITDYMFISNIIKFECYEHQEQTIHNDYHKVND